MWNTSRKNLLQNYNKKCTYASKVSKKNVFTLQYAYKRVIEYCRCHSYLSSASGNGVVRGLVSLLAREDVSQ